MLIILVGSTLEVAERSREYFAEKAYGVIRKYNYLPEGSLTEHYGKYENCSEEQVDKCDFVYPTHDGKTGFNKAQIIDAARGRSNALMTVAPDNLAFVQEIKDSFGAYVQLVYLYIDKVSLETMTRKHITSKTDIVRRLQKGAELRNLFIREKSLFDRIVIYEEDGELGFAALYEQYDSIIADAEKLQKRLNDKMYVDLPYKGVQDYVFVSYSHKDEKTILPVLSSLQREGYRIWYDEGIHTGTNWRIMLGERLQGCTNFLLFASVNSAASDNVHEEINGAEMCGHTPIVVRLDDAKFPFGYEMYLKKFQHAYITDDNLLERLKEVLSPSTKD